MNAEDIIELEDNSFNDGMPDFIGSNYASPIDHFWQTEIEYNGQNLIF